MSRSAKLLLLKLLVVLPVCGFLFFFGLGAFGLVGADEPRYAQIGREMLARHDWIVPTINGQPWLEKPVLLYWREMIAYSIFGVHDWAARIPSAIFAAGLVIVILFFMRRFRPGSDSDAAHLLTCSSPPLSALPCCAGGPGMKPDESYGWPSSTRCSRLEPLPRG